MNFTLAQTLRPRAELNKAMLRHGYAINNAGSSARIKKNSAKFAEEKGAGI